MFIAVIAAHLLAVLFSFCGVVQLCVQLSGPRPEGAGIFVSGLLHSCWPLAVAGIIELLVQIACMLEKLLQQKAEYAEVPVVRKSPVKPVAKKAEPASASGRFFRAEPQPDLPPPPAPVDKVEEPKHKSEPVKPQEPVKKDSGLSFFRVD